MLSTTEILKKVRELEIKSKKLTNHLFTGEYHSAFKGKGMSFKEVKEYSAGDDVRFIDWNVSARLGGTYSKVFEEERELSVFLLVDVSASNFLGSELQAKKDLITEICALLAFSALTNNDKVGLIFFSGAVEKYIPLAKGRPHILYMMRELILFKAQQTSTNIVKALQFLNKITRQKIFNGVRLRRPLIANHSQARKLRLVRGLPFFQKVVDGGIQFFFGRIPWLCKIIVQLHIVNGANGSLNVRIRR